MHGPFARIVAALGALLFSASSPKPVPVFNSATLTVVITWEKSNTFSNLMSLFINSSSNSMPILARSGFKSAPQRWSALYTTDYLPSKPANPYGAPRPFVFFLPSLAVSVSRLSTSLLWRDVDSWEDSAPVFVNFWSLAPNMPRISRGAGSAPLFSCLNRLKAGAYLLLTTSRTCLKYLLMPNLYGTFDQDTSSALSLKH